MKLNFTKAAIESLPPPAKGWAYHYDAKTRGLAIGISHTGARSFVVYRKVQGRPERITLGRYPDLTIEQARGKAASINSAIAHGENPADKRRQDRKEMTFGQLFAEYLQRHAKPNKRTWDEDEAMFNQYLRTLAKLKFSSLTRAQIASIHSRIGAAHPRTANKVLALVSSIFGRAAEWGLWDKPNPAKGIKKFKERSRDRFLQSDELPRFFQAVAEEPNGAIRDYVLLSLLTGARRSNVLAMRWEAISFSRGEWRIPQTKNGTPHVVTLSPEALAILANRKPAEATGYVFPGPWEDRTPGRATEGLGAHPGARWDRRPAYP
jgi:integrase